MTYQTLVRANRSTSSVGKARPFKQTGNRSRALHQALPSLKNELQQATHHYVRQSLTNRVLEETADLHSEDVLGRVAPKKGPLAAVPFEEVVRERHLAAGDVGPLVLHHPPVVPFASLLRDAVVFVAVVVAAVAGRRSVVAHASGTDAPQEKKTKRKREPCQGASGRRAAGDVEDARTAKQKQEQRTAQHQTRNPKQQSISLPTARPPARSLA